MEHDTNLKKTAAENVIPFVPDGDFYFSKGVTAFRGKKYESALKWLEKAVEAAPHDPLFKCQLSIVYTETGSYDAANEHLLDVLNQSGNTYVDCYYLLANNHAHLGLLQEARTYAETYLDKEPEGDFAEEASRLLEVIEGEELDTPDVSDSDMVNDELFVYEETIIHHLERKQWDMAIPFLQDMHIMYPEHERSWHDYALALFFKGKQTKAFQMEWDVLEDTPDDLYAHIHLAIFHVLSDEKNAYESHIQALLNVHPIDEEQKLRMAIAFILTNRYKEAFMRFQQLSKENMQDRISYYKWYSISAYRSGKHQKAEQLRKEGSRQYPALEKELSNWMK